jgi:phage terminase large subunit-like protein
MNERPEAELLLIAPTKTIADVAFKQARGIIRLDAELDKLFYAQDHIKKITHRISRAEIAIKAADTDAITGGKAAFTLIDETHEFAKKSSAAGVFVELRGALAARPDGFLLQITTQSKEPPSGVFKAELDKARAVRNGEIRLPVLAILYELPEAMAINGGWKNPATWGLVNPNLGRSVDPQFLSDQLLTAERDGPQAMALLASQHFNVQVGLGLHADRWIGADFWLGAVQKGLTLDQILDTSDVCTIGVDGGGMDDLFALAVIGRHAKTRRWQAWFQAWADPVVLERRKSIAPKLNEFAKAGDLRFGESADHEAEAADICNRVFGAGLLPAENAIGLDVFGIAGLRDALAMLGIPDEMIVGVGQGYKLQSAVLTLPRKLKDKSLVHGGQPIMDWCVSNAKAQLRGSNTVITKEAAGVGKIDPLIALFNAAMLMLANPVAAIGMTPWDADPDYRMSA